jgi:hypothetical protein
MDGKWLWYSTGGPYSQNFDSPLMEMNAADFRAHFHIQRDVTVADKVICSMCLLNNINKYSI